MSVNQRFSNLKLKGYRIRAPTMGSLLVGGVSVGGGEVPVFYQKLNILQETDLLYLTVLMGIL
jgi:hypothetical protein